MSAAFLALAMAGCGGGGDATLSPDFQTAAADRALSERPEVAVASDGTVWLAWTERAAGLESVESARIDRAGGTTLPTVSAASGEVKRSARVALSATTPVVAWREVGTAGDRIRVASHGGSGWIAEQGRGPFVTGDIDLLDAGAGRICLVWSELPPSGRIARLVAIRAASGLWSPATTVPAPTDASLVVDELHVGAADDGSLMAVWSEGPPSPSTAPTVRTLRAARFDPLLAAWQPAQTLDAGVAIVPRVVAGHGGRWLAHWISGDPLGVRELRARRYAEGAWQDTARPVDPAAGGSVRDSTAAPQGGDLPWLAWRVDTTDVPPRVAVRAARFDLATGTVSAPTPIAAPGEPQATGLALRRGTDGRRALVWGTATGPSGPFFAVTRSDVWQTASRLEPDPAILANGPGLAALPDGGFVATWFRDAGVRQDVVLRRLP